MKPITIHGPAGNIEAIEESPRINAYPHLTAIVCHPHPQYQGTMHNKVVTTVCRAFRHLGIHCIRFNYRGVENSQGSYDHGNGEVDDLTAVIDNVKQANPDQQLLLAGFSFGGSVAYKGASQRQDVAGLLTIAPAVVNFPLTEFAEPHVPWCVIQGHQDEVVSPKAVFDFVCCQTNATATIIKCQAGHFFHGKLNELKQAIIWHYQSRLADGLG